jgi:hypothetical protein
MNQQAGPAGPLHPTFSRRRVADLQVGGRWIQCQLVAPAIAPAQVPHHRPHLALHPALRVVRHLRRRGCNCKQPAAAGSCTIMRSSVRSEQAGLAAPCCGTMLRIAIQCARAPPHLDRVRRSTRRCVALVVRVLVPDQVLALSAAVGRELAADCTPELLSVVSAWLPPAVVCRNYHVAGGSSDDSQ